MSKTPSLTLITGRSSAQGKFLHLGKDSKEFQEEVLRVDMNAEDMARRGLEGGAEWARHFEGMFTDDEIRTGRLEDEDAAGGRGCETRCDGGDARSANAGEAAAGATKANANANAFVHPVRSEDLTYGVEDGACEAADCRGSESRPHHPPIIAPSPERGPRHPEPGESAGPERARPGDDAHPP